MSVFQYIGLTVFGLLAASNFRRLLNGRSAQGAAAAWLILSCVGAAVMLAPDATTGVARALGIRRGADLLLYTSILTGLVVTFLVYARMRATDRQITLIVRELAIENARRPDGHESGVTEPDDGLGSEVDFFDQGSSPAVDSGMEYGS